MSTSRRSTPAASADLPDAGRPVNQTVAPDWPRLCQRSNRVSADGLQTTFVLLAPLPIEYGSPLAMAPD